MFPIQPPSALIRWISHSLMKLEAGTTVSCIDFDAPYDLIPVSRYHCRSLLDWIVDVLAPPKRSKFLETKARLRVADLHRPNERWIDAHWNWKHQEIQLLYYYYYSYLRKILFKVNFLAVYNERHSIVYSYGLCLESLVQWAAVRMCFGPMRAPPHQNSVRRGPCRNMAAIHGQRPGSDSSPPTTRNFSTCGCPQSGMK